MPATIRDEGGALRISVPYRRSPAATAVVLTAIAVDIGIVIVNLLGLPMARYGGIGPALDLLAPPAIVVLCLILVSRRLTREDIVVNGCRLRHRYAMGSIPISVTRTFAFDRIHHLQALDDPVGPFGPGRITIFGATGHAGHGTIAFEHGGRRYRIGSSLDVIEAQQMIDLIRAHAEGRANGSPPGS